MKNTAQKGIVEYLIAKTKSGITEIENRQDLSKEQKVSRVINVFSGVCAGAAIQPLPFADIFILTPIQIYMGSRIAAIHGVPIKEAEIKNTLIEIGGAIGLGLVAQQTVIGLYKTVLPFLGAVTTIPLVYGLTFGIGKVMDKYFEAKSRGEKLSKEQILEIFKREKKQGKKEGKRRKEEIKQGSTNIQHVKGIQHRKELYRAIKDAQEVLCVLSGWLSGKVINDELIECLQNAAERGVEIYIGYGWTDPNGRHKDSRSSKEALNRLKQLQYKYKNKIFIGKFNTHEKTLIKDNEYYFMGSFNWLSNSSCRNSEKSVKIYDAEKTFSQLKDAKEKILNNMI